MRRGRLDVGEADLVRDSIVRHSEALKLERLRLYRLHLQVTVRKVSPLVLDLAAYTGSRFDDVVDEFAPRSTWPDGDLGKVGPRSRPNAGSQRWIGHKHSNAAREWRRNHRRGVVRGGAASGAQIVFMVMAGRVEALAALAGCALQTMGSYASLHLPDALPETVAAALPGRDVDALFGHPVLDGRGYVVEHVHAGFSGGEVVTFRTGSLPCELPWRDLFDAEMERGR